MRVPQTRQRPRRRRYEKSGMLSRRSIGVAHAMHAEAGRTMERRSGTRAATTFRKLPSARPGKKAARAAAAISTGVLRRHRGGVDRLLARHADRHVREPAEGRARRLPELDRAAVDRPVDE